MEAVELLLTAGGAIAVRDADGGEGGITVYYFDYSRGGDFLK